MGGPKLLSVALVAGLAAVGAGCSKNQPEELKTRELIERLRAEAAAEAEAEAAAQPVRPAAAPTERDPVGPAQRDGVIVIESRPEEEPGPSLVEAAHAERQRRAVANPPSIVITNKNLHEYSTGELTVADPGPPGVSSGDGGPSQPQTAQGEAYWRQRVKEIRLRWRGAADLIEDLEAKIAGLRQQFYAADDPHYRDSQIKPAWDSAIEQLDDARGMALAASRELEAVLDEGRQAGALPGWLREGIEFQPEVVAPVDPAEARTFAEPIEPPIAEQPRR